MKRSLLLALIIACTAPTVVVHRFWRALIALAFELTPSFPGVANGSSPLTEDHEAAL